MAICCDPVAPSSRVPLHIQGYGHPSIHDGAGRAPSKRRSAGGDGIGKGGKGQRGRRAIGPVASDVKSITTVV